MRILIWLDRLTFRGAIYRALELSILLNDAGHQVMVMSNGGPLFQAFKDAGIDIRVLKQSDRYSALPFVAGRSMRGMIKRFRPDVCHLGTLSDTLQVRKLCRREGAALVATVLSSNDPALDDRQLFSDCDAVVAASQSIRAAIATKTGIATARIRIIRAGLREVDPKYKMAKEKRKTQREKAVIGAFGELHDREALQTLLRAGRELRKRGKEFHLLFVGEGKGFSFLREWIEHNDAGSWVLAMDELYDYRDLLRRADIVVAPEDSHECVTFALKALAMGLPAVMAAKGGNFELINDDKAGLLYPPEDAGVLADRLERLLADLAWRERYAARGLSAVEGQLSVERMLEKTIEVYTQVIDGSIAHRRGRERHSSSVNWSWTGFFKQN